MSRKKQDLLKNLEVMLSNLEDYQTYLTAQEEAIPNIPWGPLIESTEKTLLEIHELLPHLVGTKVDIMDQYPLLYSHLHANVQEILSTALGRKVPFSLDIILKPTETIH